MGACYASVQSSIILYWVKAGAALLAWGVAGMTFWAKSIYRWLGAALKKEIKGDFHISDLTKVRFVPEVSCAVEKVGLGEGK